MGESVDQKTIGNGGYRISEDINVPAIFSNVDGIGKDLFPSKGQFNLVEMRPEVINEQNSSFRSVQAVIDSSTIVGQGFKNSQDNMNGISLVFEPAEAGATHENFESYADSAALRLAWVQIGPGSPADLETTIVSPNFSSTKSMKLSLDNLLGNWANTEEAIDVSGKVIAIDWLQTDTYSRLKAELYISDGVNQASVDIVSGATNVYETFIWNISDFQPDLSNQSPVDLTAIVTFGYRLLESRQNRFGYADNMILFNLPGSINSKLWNFGPTAPVGGVDSIDDSTSQYTTLGDPGIGQGTLVSQVNIPIQSSKAIYFVQDFIAGTAFELDSNVELIPNNYYLITLHYVDTDVSVYGTDPSESVDRYTNGFAFTAPNEADPITAIGPFNDIFFNIYSTQDVLFTTALLTAHDEMDEFASPGNDSIFSLYVIDVDFKITTWIVKHERFEQVLNIKSDFRAVEMEKGGKIVFLLNDDAADDVHKVNVAYSYLYKPPLVNG